MPSDDKIPTRTLQYGEKSYAQMESSKAYAIPKGERTLLIYPMPEILRHDGLADDEWERLLNMPLWQLRELLNLTKWRKSAKADLVYPIDTDIPPPAYWGGPGRPPMSHNMNQQSYVDDFIPPFDIKGPRPAWPFKIMEPGDSFAAPAFTKVRNGLGGYTRSEQERGRRVVFVGRSINKDWVRIWCLWDTYGPDNNGLVKPDSESTINALIQQSNQRKAEREEAARRKAESYDPTKRIIGGISDQQLLDAGLTLQEVQGNDSGMDISDPGVRAYMLDWARKNR